MIGMIIGKFDWNTMKNRIDQRNVMIIYSTEYILYSFIFILFIAQMAPRTFLSLAIHLDKITNYLFISLLLITSLVTGQTFKLFISIRKYEMEKGRIIPRLFWTNSVTGEQGMILKTGIVLKKCDPEGKVKIGSEIWNAKSIDNKLIPEHYTIIVRDIIGLQLVVERAIE